MIAIQAIFTKWINKIGVHSETTLLQTSAIAWNKEAEDVQQFQAALHSSSDHQSIPQHQTASTDTTSTSLLTAPHTKPHKPYS